MKKMVKSDSKSFLFKSDADFINKVKKFAYDYNFPSTTEFIRFAITSTMDCMLMPEAADSHYKAARRIYYHK